VQNNILELLSMLSFLMPTVFSSSSRELLVEALKNSTNAVGNTPNAKLSKKQKKEKDNQNPAQQKGDLSLDQLTLMLAPFVLRRLKRDVLNQLTDKVRQSIQQKHLPLFLPLFLLFLLFLTYFVLFPLSLYHYTSIPHTIHTTHTTHHTHTTHTT
jgi:SNF2 family DNA or RNA helicase